MTQGPIPPRRFEPRPPQPTMHPRKVRGGVKPLHAEGEPLAWAGQRWMRLIEDCAPNAALTEGLQYARLGQTRSLTIASGHIAARVQGRLPTAYTVDVRLPVFSHDQWEQTVHAMLEESRHMANILAGEVKPGIEDLFAPLHLRLFPLEASDLALACTCGRQPPPMAPRLPLAQRPMGMPMPDVDEQDADTAESPAPVSMPPSGLPPTLVPTGGPPAPGLASGAPSSPAEKSPWCKHVCCAMALVADRLSRDPFLIFQLRGLAKEDLLERLRQRRAVVASSKAAGGADRPVPAYSPRIPGVGDSAAPPLELEIHRFWSMGQGADQLDLSMEAPAVSHALLRRLGASPFDGARFPLIGLLSTCYDMFSERAAKDANADAEGPAGIVTDENASGSGDGVGAAR